ERTNFTPLRVAILGGQTTNDIKNVLDVFLLNYGIKADFYESEYNMYYEDGMFDNPELVKFAPEIIYVCTCIRNISSFPEITDCPEDAAAKLSDVYNRFEGLWEHLASKYNCPVIQNNFEYPYYRLMGNKDASSINGRVNFITRLNLKFADYADSHKNFYINDINYQSASYGLESWSDPYYWHMYKYAVTVAAIPYLSFNIANIIKSLLGKNKKVLMLDMDNTLWGGVIGDDGADNIEIGQETSISQTYSEFQSYVKAHKDLGILLAINSKNDRETAVKGLERPDSVLREDDFVSMKINWEPKSSNLAAAANELNLLPESFVFVDDNPAEREIIRQNLPNTAVPEIGNQAERYINILDKSGFFELTNYSKDDAARNEMYKANAKRTEALSSFSNYKDYLLSLEMKGEIQSFIPAWMSRIAQLTNKSNQFNLTTKRYTQTEIESVAADDKYITLYGKLSDKFGDNGVVSVAIGHIEESTCHIDLWIMSCRVLKRDMEYAMMDKFVAKCRERNLKMIKGYYYPTAKNAMVKDFYSLHGFEKISEDGNGNSEWLLKIADYKNKNDVISL
ncbi:MAG: HAD-IIIC family phosphatase, partial [Lachnospiraceae bacterium]|nr:HAD-IIIC family phosphatase [Lachnospiraceae bacterium]